MQNVTAEQMVKALEALSPDLVAAIRASKATEAEKTLFISEKERRYIPKGLIRLAEAACPEWRRNDFSVRRWVDAVTPAIGKLTEAYSNTMLREAHSETALAFLLRKGVQTIANDWYNVVPREWQDYAGTAQSNTLAEFYTPLYASTIAGQVSNGERFPEGRIIGENSVMVNYKFGLIESFDRELFDDDQTAQIRLRASRLGQGMAITENVYAAIRFIGIKGTYQNLTVQASNYSTTDVFGNPITGPWSPTLYGTAGVLGGSGNMPASFIALGLVGLKAAWTALLNAKDPLSNKIIVNPNTLLVSSMDALHAPLLVTPPQGVPYYPAPIGSGAGQMGQSGTPQTAATATSGYPGGIMSANPFMGLGIKVVVARFLNDWAWSLGEKGKGFMWQERDALEVIQENPAAGAAFEVDAYRFRSRRRFEVDWIGGGSRFWYLGNSGSVNNTGVTVAGVTGVVGAF